MNSTKLASRVETVAESPLANAGVSPTGPVRGPFTESITGPPITPPLLFVPLASPARRLALGRLLAGLAALIGALVTCGWILNIALLKSVVPGYITMKLNTAVGLIMLAGALVLAAKDQDAGPPISTGWRKLLAQGLCVVTIALSIATLAEYVLAVNLHVDELLVADPDGITGRFPPGRLAPITAICFVLIAASFLTALSDWGKKRGALAQNLLIVSLFISLQGFFGYVIGVRYTFGSAFYTQMAIHTAIGLIFLSFGGMVCVSGQRLVSVLLAQTAGGRSARVLTIAVVAVPPLITWLSTRGESLGLYDADFAVLTRLVAVISILTIVIWRNAFQLHEAELARAASEALSRESTERYQEILLRSQQDLERLVTVRTEELSAANKELEAFSYSVSHDLRAPLRSIDGFGKLLAERYQTALDTRGQDYVSRMRAATNRMGRLIDDLLNFSRLSRTQMSFHAVNLSEMVSSIADDLLQANPERDIKFVVQEGLCTEGDPELLRIALTNLVGNAVKYTGRNAKAVIEFGAKNAPEGLDFFVKDDGAGFDMAYAGQLFGAFHRLHTDREFEGTGIGLATVRRILHRHGGEIRAESEVEKGATFYFHIGTPKDQTPSKQEPR